MIPWYMCIDLFPVPFSRVAVLHRVLEKICCGTNAMMSVLSW